MPILKIFRGNIADQLYSEKEIINTKSKDLRIKKAQMNICKRDMEELALAKSLVQVAKNQVYALTQIEDFMEFIHADTNYQIGSISSKVIGNYFDLKEFNKQAEKYASIKLSEANVEAVIKELFPIKNDMTERVKASVEEKIEEFRKCLNAEDLRNFRGTAWHMIEAYADYRTHLAPKRETSTMLDNKFVSVTFDSRPLLMMMAAINKIAA